MFGFVWLGVNSSVNVYVAFFSYFSPVIEVFFRCYLRITRRSMLRSKDELNTRKSARPMNLQIALQYHLLRKLMATYQKMK